jgi:hypothetical protein
VHVGGERAALACSDAAASPKVLYCNLCIAETQAVLIHGAYEMLELNKMYAHRSSCFASVERDPVRWYNSSDVTTRMNSS